MIVDAHLHVWDPSRASYPWLTAALHPLDRTLLLDDVSAELERAGVDRVVLVQAVDNAGDTAVMRAEAERHPERVAGIVAWLPLDDPDAVARGLEDAGGDPLFVGVRNLIHDREPGWLSQARQSESLGLLARAGVPLDFVTASADALAEIPEILDRHPDLRLVIDHLGKPPIGGSDADRTAWRQSLRVAAAHPLVHAKVSGLYPPVGDPRAWVADDLRPFLDDAAAEFGVDRLMYGSDWPIVERAGGHGLVHAALVELTRGWSVAERDALFAATATTFYRLQPPIPERTA
ncbi:amidohydrolase family protein [Microbacterium sp. PA5]|uniref:amidohydrolase family protein n=1 Tax=Microbacterium sp. PA5 TaxID=3416654 RepID=UPI003CF3A3FF